MKYDLGSDLHVDINAGRIGMVRFKEMKNAGSDTIVLAGDISNDPELTVKVLAMAASAYENVIFVDGNHEHYSNGKYGLDVSGAMGFFKEAIDLIPNVTYLSGDNNVIIDDTMFVGANAWYDFRMAPPQYTPEKCKEAWETSLNDFRLSNFDVEPEVLAGIQSALIADQVSKAQDNDDVKKIVVVTHTVPNTKGLLVKNNPSWDILNGCFGNSTMSNVWQVDTNRKIIHAVCGHTHYPNDFVDNDGIRFVINPRGYHGAENELGDRWFLVQMDTSDERI